MIIKLTTRDLGRIALKRDGSRHIIKKNPNRNKAEFPFKAGSFSYNIHGKWSCAAMGSNHDLDIVEIVDAMPTDALKIIADLTLDNVRYERAIKEALQQLKLHNISKTASGYSERAAEILNKVMKAKAFENLKEMIAKNEIKMPTHKVPGWCK